ncbi:MAG TPA: hypothetical protein VLT32_06730, partial [Candidatus Sulfomarinibacteraceae bacterium]|nr:hypothetical protein [Candidatus Sulfomarinibacteraceae bacterium]
WQALPPTYQRDITELTHGFAAKVDPAVWEAAFGVGRRTAGLLRDKKEIILSSSFLENAGEERDEIASGWDSMVALLDAFFSSEVSKVDALKTMDWERYLATTGRDLMKLAADKSRASGDDAFEREFTQKLKRTEAEVVSRDGDSATVKIITPGEEPEEMELVRVEGRWVPADMAEGWDQDVAEARAKLASITEEEVQQGSMQMMMLIGMADGVIAQLETAETAEEFEQAIQGILGPFLGGMMAAGEAGELVLEPEADADSGAGSDPE